MEKKHGDYRGSSFSGQPISGKNGPFCGGSPCVWMSQVFLAGRRGDGSVSDGTLNLRAAWCLKHRITSYNVCYTKLLRYPIIDDPFFFHKLDVMNHNVVRKIYQFLAKQFEKIFKA